MIPVDIKINSGCTYRKSNSHRPTKSSNKEKYFVGVDGEGQGRDPHLYTLLAWSDEAGIERDWVENKKGLTTVECFEFLLEIPKRAKAFAYAFNYDLTKMFTDIDNETLFKLFRPETRPSKNKKLGPAPIPWGDYLINLQMTKFTIECSATKRRRVIWDVFKFFQSKFTAALVDWKVATFEELEEMRTMKDKRSEHDQVAKEEGGFDRIRLYCLDECAKMATLASNLVKAHEDADLVLKSFYGAGSTGGAMLKKMGIDKEKRVALPEMHEAIACGFFGGRFENSVIGEVKGPLWSYDISSAYPYETTFLPCLECGEWSLTQNRSELDDARAALVHYGLGTAPPNLSWGPFPFRMRDGSICYPVESGGGWVWDKEYLEGERIFPHVQFREAWIYKGDCRHQPFNSIPDYYLVRLKIGKEGKGIVIKLGVNSVYGKLAQSVGEAPPFQCWIWAGMITSGTRAQILRALSLHKDPSNLLMVATDGICSRERLVLPTPSHTGTMTEHKKPLGGWEEKEVKKGVFFVRPGIYFPLDPTPEELKTVRARGVGRAVMYNAWQKLVESWNEGKRSIELAEVTRFCGAKSSLSVSRKPGVVLAEGVAPTNIKDLDVRWDELIFTRSPLYGEWIKRPVELSFNPEPKREKEFGASVQRGSKTRILTVRKFLQDMSSTPYKRSLESQEAQDLKRLNDELLEQPDGADFVEYDE